MVSLVAKSATAGVAGAVVSATVIVVALLSLPAASVAVTVNDDPAV